MKHHSEIKNPVLRAGFFRFLAKDKNLWGRKITEPLPTLTKEAWGAQSYTKRRDQNGNGSTPFRKTSRTQREEGDQR